MATSNQSPEQRELSLIGKVEMRIALADSDSKLEATLKTYLAPLLLKLASEHQSVRNKVVSVCQHINTRVKPQSIRLPVAALIKQFKDQENSPLIRNFDLLYIQQGVTRLSAGDKADLLPIVIRGISSSGTHGAQIFNLLLRLLDFYKLPNRGTKEDAELRTSLQVSDQDAAYLATWIGRLVLYTPTRSGGQSSPGLTKEDCAFLTLQGREDTWNVDAGGLSHQHSKTLVGKLLASGIFNNDERFLPALFATADAVVDNLGEDMMKRALPATDLENDRLVSQLFLLYFGEAGRPRVRAALRVKILSLFMKSVQSTTHANQISKLIDDGISPPESDREDTYMTNGSSAPPPLGREALKVRAAIFSYINFVARFGSHETLHEIAPDAVIKLRDFVESQGWPKVANNEDLVSRGYAYEVIGLLAKAGPRRVLVESEHPTLDLLRWLFDSLAKDTSGNTITVSIEESLSTILTAFSRLRLTPDEQSVMEDLLADQMVLSDDLKLNDRIRSTRYVTIRFANRCLPYASVKARMVNVLGAGAKNDRLEVREEAERGLSPYWFKMLNGSVGSKTAELLVFPQFVDVMSHFFAGRTLDPGIEPQAVAAHAVVKYAGSVFPMTAYGRRILFNEALQQLSKAPDIVEEWERKLDAIVENDAESRKVIKSYLTGFRESPARALETLLFAELNDVLQAGQGADGSVVTLLALCPDEVVARLASSAVQLLPVLQSNNISRRRIAAQTFGILASHPALSKADINPIIEQLIKVSRSWEGAVGAKVSEVHGATLALGFYFSRCSMRKTVPVEETRNAFTSHLLQVLSAGSDRVLKEASMVALGQLAMATALPQDIVEKGGGMRSTVDNVYELAKSGNENAILCLGQLSMVLPEGESSKENDLQYLIERLHKLHEVREAEIHFTVGEAMSYAAIGWRSDALATRGDVHADVPELAARQHTLERLLQSTLTDIAATKPALRKASVIWLLCLVQFCGMAPEVQGRLAQCQAAFKRCLSDRDELVQETASRGLGLVYEKGDRNLKDDLVRDLVSSFSSDKQSQLAGSVSADTQLFEPGALPTGDGSVSTYKDIMSLASEVGDSSLVYKFMSMASSNAIWSSRAAFGRFGLSSVLSDSSVDGYLAKNPKLYPKLFRYRFDPNGGVQRAMNDIWNALVKDSSATIEAHFDAIMEDLLGSILGREWRVRQASCAAIADLVQGRSIDRYQDYLERIWTLTFKVLDDIKESVRAAAGSLARVLTNVLTRTLESDNSGSKAAATMLKHVLPFLLSPSGMESSAQEVQVFAVHTLLEIIKKGNATTLRPFIPELVERLVGLLSSLEPEAVNYIHLNAAKYNLTEQKIDDMRLSSVRGSPIMEAIERCLDLVDMETMVELSPRLQSAMRAAVGLPSKVGSGRILVSMSTRRIEVFRPFADEFLRLIEKLVLDRNETVAASYAVAAGYTARVATDKQILRLGAFCRKLYFGSEGDREGVLPRKAISAGEMMHAVAKHASDRFNTLASSLLPFVFVAKHDSHELVKEAFSETWDEAVGGSRAVLLYLREILDLCNEHLDSAQWILKHTAARSVADAVEAVGSLSSGDMSSETARLLWPALDKALGGKTWEGKEVLLPALVKFVEHGKRFYHDDVQVATSTLKIAYREAKRQNAAYRPHALAALSQVVKARRDIDASEEVLGIAATILDRGEAADDADAMEVDTGAEASVKASHEAAAARAAEMALACINPDVIGGQQLERQLVRAVRLVTGSPSRTTAAVQRGVFDEARQLFERIRAAEQSQYVGTDAVEAAICTLLVESTVGSEMLRLKRADALAAVALCLKQFNGGGSSLRQGMVHLAAEEPSREVKARLKAALDLTGENEKRTGEH